MSLFIVKAFDRKQLVFLCPANAKPKSAIRIATNICVARFIEILSNIEAEVDDIAFLDHILLAL